MTHVILIHSFPTAPCTPGRELLAAIANAASGYVHGQAALSQAGLSTPTRILEDTKGLSLLSLVSDAEKVRQKEWGILRTLVRDLIGTDARPSLPLLLVAVGKGKSVSKAATSLAKVLGMVHKGISVATEAIAHADLQELLTTPLAHASPEALTALDACLARVAATHRKTRKYGWSPLNAWAGYTPKAKKPAGPRITCLASTDADADADARLSPHTPTALSVSMSFEDSLMSNGGNSCSSWLTTSSGTNSSSPTPSPPNPKQSVITILGFSCANGDTATFVGVPATYPGPGCEWSTVQLTVVGMGYAFALDCSALSPSEAAKVMRTVRACGPKYGYPCAKATEVRDGARLLDGGAKPAACVVRVTTQCVGHANAVRHDLAANAAFAHLPLLDWLHPEAWALRASGLRVGQTYKLPLEASASPSVTLHVSDIGPAGEMQHLSESEHKHTPALRVVAIHAVRSTDAQQHVVGMALAQRVTSSARQRVEVHVLDAPHAKDRAAATVNGVPAFDDKVCGDGAIDAGVVVHRHVTEAELLDAVAVALATASPHAIVGLRVREKALKPLFGSQSEARSAFAVSGMPLHASVDGWESWPHKKAQRFAPLFLREREWAKAAYVSAAVPQAYRPSGETLPAPSNAAQTGMFGRAKRKRHTLPSWSVAKKRARPKTQSSGSGSGSDTGSDSGSGYGATSSASGEARKRWGAPQVLRFCAPRANVDSRWDLDLPGYCVVDLASTPAAKGGSVDKRPALLSLQEIALNAPTPIRDPIVHNYLGAADWAALRRVDGGAFIGALAQAAAMELRVAVDGGFVDAALGEAEACAIPPTRTLTASRATKTLRAMLPTCAAQGVALRHPTESAGCDYTSYNKKCVEAAAERKAAHRKALKSESASKSGSGSGSESESSYGSKTHERKRALPRKGGDAARTVFKVPGTYAWESWEAAQERRGLSKRGTKRMRAEELARSIGLDIASEEDDDAAQPSAKRARTHTRKAPSAWSAFARSNLPFIDKDARNKGGLITKPSDGTYGPTITVDGSGFYPALAVKHNVCPTTMRPDIAKAPSAALEPRVRRFRGLDRTRHPEKSCEEYEEVCAYEAQRLAQGLGVDPNRRTDNPGSGGVLPHGLSENGGLWRVTVETSRGAYDLHGNTKSKGVVPAYLAALRKSRADLSARAGATKRAKRARMYLARARAAKLAANAAIGAFGGGGDAGKHETEGGMVQTAPFTAAAGAVLSLGRFAMETASEIGALIAPPSSDAPWHRLRHIMTETDSVTFELRGRKDARVASAVPSRAAQDAAGALATVCAANGLPPLAFESHYAFLAVARGTQLRVDGATGAARLFPVVGRNRPVLLRFFARLVEGLVTRGYERNPATASGTGSDGSLVLPPQVVKDLRELAQRFAGAVRSDALPVAAYVYKARQQVRAGAGIDRIVPTPDSSNGRPSKLGPRVRDPPDNRVLFDGTRLGTGGDPVVRVRVLAAGDGSSGHEVCPFLAARSQARIDASHYVHELRRSFAPVLAVACGKDLAEVRAWFDEAKAKSGSDSNTATASKGLKDALQSKISTFACVRALTRGATGIWDTFEDRSMHAVDACIEAELAASVVHASLWWVPDLSAQGHTCGARALDAFANRRGIPLCPKCGLDLWGTDCFSVEECARTLSVELGALKNKLRARAVS